MSANGEKSGLSMSAGQRLPGSPEPAHRWQGSQGVTIAGDSWGDPDGPLVLLLHGGGQTRHAWKNVGVNLGNAGYHAVALDARGHGDSDWAPDGKYGQDVMVEDLLCVIEQLGGKRPVLVGASLGGGTSLVAIGEDRVDATALVLVDIAPDIEPAGSKRINDFMAARPEGYDSLDEVADAIAAYQPQRKRRRDLSGLAKNLRLGANGKYRWHWDPKFMQMDRDVELRTKRLSACARALKLPTLLVRGGLSDLLTEEGANRFLELCPHSEFANIAEAGHMVAGDRNDIFGSAVIEFLQRAVPVKGGPVYPAHETHPHHLGPPGDIVDIP